MQIEYIIFLPTQSLKHSWAQQGGLCTWSFVCSQRNVMLNDCQWMLKTFTTIYIFFDFVILDSLKYRIKKRLHAGPEFMPQSQWNIRGSRNNMHCKIPTLKCPDIRDPLFFESNCEDDSFGTLMHQYELTSCVIVSLKCMYHKSVSKEICAQILYVYRISLN